MIILHEDNPFAGEVIESHSRKRVRTASGTTQINGESVTVSLERSYTPVLFTRVAQYRELLNELSLEGSKLFIYIALHLGYEEQKIYIKRRDVGMSEKVFSRGMLELIGYRVISPVQHKRELYWVNLVIICVGTVQIKKK